jgi:hypothetical protein
MIGKASTATSFGDLARYLEAGHRGTEPERVAWRAARNLPTDDPRLAAAFMQAEASANGRVERPVYHLVIAFDSTDRPTPPTMTGVAERVLADLGLADHQALLVAHRDTAHPHVHLMVNRVHPGTGRAWDTRDDYARVERALRGLERELGLRAVPGRHTPSAERPATRLAETAVIPEAERDARRAANRDPGRSAEPPGTPTTTRSTDRGERVGERVGERIGLRDGDARRGASEAAVRPMPGAPAAHARATPISLAERARAALPELRAARTWRDFETALARHGLRYAARGGGGVILPAGGPTADATRDPTRDPTTGAPRVIGTAVKASRVAPDLSRPRLEARFGVPYERHEDVRDTRDARRAETSQGAPTTPDVRAPAARRSEVARARGGLADASPSVRHLAVRLAQYERALRLEHALAAAAALRARAESRVLAMDAARDAAAGAERVFRRSLAAVYAAPDAAYGAIVEVARADGPGRAVALLRERPEAYGPLHAVETPRRFGLGRTVGTGPTREAARLAATRADAWQAATRAVPAPATRAAAEASVAHHRRRHERLHERSAAEAARPARDLAPTIGQAISRLTPAQLQELRGLVTPRQFAVGDAVHAALREASVLRPPSERSSPAARERTNGPAPADVRWQGRAAGQRHARAASAGRAAHEVLAQLAPRELRTLRAVTRAVTAPHHAVVQSIRRAIRDAVLGHDGAER